MNNRLGTYITCIRIGKERKYWVHHWCTWVADKSNHLSENPKLLHCNSHLRQEFPFSKRVSIKLRQPHFRTEYSSERKFQEPNSPDWINMAELTFISIIKAHSHHEKTKNVWCFIYLFFWIFFFFLFFSALLTLTWMQRELTRPKLSLSLLVFRRKVHFVSAGVRMGMGMN